MSHTVLSQMFKDKEAEVERLNHLLRGIETAAETMHRRQQQDLIELRAEVERLTAAARAAFDALEDGDEAGAHLILQALLRNTALEDGK